ncbi:TPA: hypothetical protein KDY95_003418 [Vibrio cholerae]|nr:hypothetical protein [Vibrio cholerae]
MDIVELAQVAGSIFTGASVLFAMFVYRRNSDKEMFKEFRLSMIDFKHNIQEIDRLLAEPLFSEVSSNIALELEKILPDNCTKEQFVEFMTNEENHDFIGQAIHIGRIKSNKVERINELLSLVEKTPYSYAEILPATSKSITGIVKYIDQVTRQLLSPRLFDAAIGTPESFNKYVVSDLENIDSLKLALCVTSGTMIAACSSVLMGQGQRVFDEAENLLNAIISEHVELSDKLLRVQSRSQKKHHSSVLQIDEETNIEDAFKALKYVKDMFSDDKWEKIVESKTTLYNLAHVENG